MPPMRAVLEARRKAAAVRVEELEAELVRVRTDLADAEEVRRRRVIGLEEYVDALAEDGAPAVVAVGSSSRRKAVGPRRAAPHRENAAGVEDLSVDYQALMAAARDAGGWAGCSACSGGAGLGQRVRLPGRGREGAAEAAGGTRVAGRGEAGQVHAVRAGAGHC